MSRKRSIELNKKYGRLTILEETYHSNTSNYKKLQYKCICDCGKYITVRSYAISSGNTKSCGCLASELTSKRLFKGNGISGFNCLVHRYKASAKKRNLKFNLTDFELKKLFEANCSICNINPNNIAQTLGQSYTEETRLKSQYIYNGIDRIDNNLGYIIGNVQTMCNVCNRAKSDITLEEFNNWLKRIRNEKN